MNWAGLEADLDTAGYARLPGVLNVCAYRDCATRAPTGGAQRVRLPGVLNTRECRAQVRPGTSRLLAGSRFTLGITFRDTE